MISINNSLVSTTAPVSAIVGALTMTNADGAALPANFILTKSSSGTFGISGSNLVTERSAIPPGIYSVRVRGIATNANYSNKTYITIIVTI
jgi:hypothetical protein